ncbi:MAG TPA: type II toxin-antitoxin system VapC family toxin [Dehalococcoidia bacterium]|nr:type II toxin-antitoxin system VapC family toxin [Dehalococcoidia bacterium]
MNGGPAVVLDASALLAAVRGEPGGDRVESQIGVAAMCAVNWAEVAQKSLAYGIDAAALRADLVAAGLTIVPFAAEDAEVSARLWFLTQSSGLSLADRACLSLALRLGVPALTADRLWADIDVGVDVQVVR